ncbi:MULTISPECIES: LLM class flavin-dependent oxidoreductase [Sphingobium]|uniref:LLM class flavin-dependent oxidoreductase n=1 Tax=Sphingobium TaxID=165695 RepID=UPI00159C0940|nr:MULTISPECIES: LLM class flavin-dependent oxidoreductase [unclassified Sphingobium]
MRFGLIYEQQLPRPWSEDDERKLFENSLAQVELADRLGFDYAWANEHHFLEEYAHSSAPEVFLAAAARNTKRIRLGHAVVLTLPAYNHPARVAERSATLDLISNGRLELGTGESASAIELEGFNIKPDDKREAWREGTAEMANMMAMTPYPGYQGEFFSMPARNVVPKPVQKPHPPLWLACSNKDSIVRAAKMGMGALTFAFVSYEEAKKWVDLYYETIRTECVPIGHTVNANIALVSAFSIHKDREEAVRRGLDHFRFFGFSSGHYYIFGEHKPGRSDIAGRFNEELEKLPKDADTYGIGTPEDLRDHVRKLQEIGVDQVIFLQQSGRLSNEHITESMELFAQDVMPEFAAEADARDAKKQAELAPYIEAALARKQARAPMADHEIPVTKAFGKRFYEVQGEQKNEEEQMALSSQSLFEKGGAADKYAEANPLHAQDRPKDRAVG